MMISGKDVAASSRQRRLSTSRTGVGRARESRITSRTLIHPRRLDACAEVRCGTLPGHVREGYVIRRVTNNCALDRNALRGIRDLFVGKGNSLPPRVREAIFTICGSFFC